MVKLSLGKMPRLSRLKWVHRKTNAPPGWAERSEGVIRLSVASSLVGIGADNLAVIRRGDRVPGDVVDGGLHEADGAVHEEDVDPTWVKRARIHHGNRSAPVGVLVLVLARRTVGRE